MRFIRKPILRTMKKSVGLAFLCLLLLSTCQSLKNSQSSSEMIEYTLLHEGYERLFYVHLPPPEQLERSMPLLFHLHGGGGTAKRTPALTFNRFNTLADREGFIVVYPQAIEKNWNDGRKSSLVKAWQENIDDVGFIVKIIEKMVSEYNINEDRIFTSGMSNGGFMSTRLLCDRADLFRGGAILTAQISEDYLPQCDPAVPTAVLVMNGTDDQLVPYDGGEIMVLKRPRGKIISTDEFVKFWQEKNNCNQQLATVRLPDEVDDGTHISIDEYKGCDDRGALILYTVHGGGHTWPGGKQYLGERWIGKTSREINACDVIWNYFEGLN